MDKSVLLQTDVCNNGRTKICSSKAHQWALCFQERLMRLMGGVSFLDSYQFRRSRIAGVPGWKAATLSLATDWSESTSRVHYRT
jgi:hypothetical protein